MSGVSLKFSEMDLTFIAAGYNKKKHRAPLVLGHPTYDKPEYGEVDSLFVSGNVLYAQANVSDELVTMVRAGTYKNISAGFLSPTNPANPTPHTHYLRHVGFLGAMLPAVKGLAALNFTEQSGCVNFSEVFPIKDNLGVFNPAPCWGGYSVDPERQQIFNLAKDYQRVCLDMSFAEAAGRAEAIILNQKRI